MEWVLPQALQLLFERIEGGQGLVLRQQLVQPSLVGFLEGGAIRQQQPETALDRLLAGQVTQGLGGLELGAAAIADHLAEHLHDVEAVEDDGGVRQAVLHGGDIGRPHVQRHRLNAVGALLRQGIEEFQQHGGFASLLDPQNAAVARSGRQVIDQGEVALPLGAGNFIDTKVTNPGQGLRPGYRDRLGQVGAFDGFHRIPRQTRVTRHRRDRHVPGHAGNQAGVAFRHARLGRHEGQGFDAHMPWRQEGLGVLDLDFAAVPTQRHVLHRPSQQAIDGTTPPRAVIHRPTAPVAVADDPYPSASFVDKLP